MPSEPANRAKGKAMSEQQINVLKKMIDAERLYFRKCVAARRGQYVSPDLRLVEVGKINGVPTRTAQSLVEMDSPRRQYQLMASATICTFES
jgi:hypothetical protein